MTPQAKITPICNATLDTLLAPLMASGSLRTQHRITGATEYRGPAGDLLAITIGGKYFAQQLDPFEVSQAKFLAGLDDNHAVVCFPAPDTSPLDGIYIQSIGRSMRPVDSLAMGMQMVGRIKRHPQPVQWTLENPKTGEIIARGEFPGDAK